jgi:plastocyanin
MAIIVGFASLPEAHAAGSGPQTLPVSVDARVGGINATYDTYFPSDLTVHPGDTLRFAHVNTGAPHTVTFGTLVDAGLAAQDGPGVLAPDVAALAKLPELLPNGTGPSPQSSVQPCFLTSAAPVSAACPKVRQPSFDGKQSYYSSGFLAPTQVFTVRLAPNIAPGTYRYFCLLHRGIMQGKVSVVDASTPTPTPAQVQARATDQIAAAAENLRAARTGTQQQVQQRGPTNVVAGVFGSEPIGIQLTEFLPANISIQRGTTVTWNVLGDHTISFNSPAQAEDPLRASGQGRIAKNELMFRAAHSPPVPIPDPTKPSSATITIDAGSWNGRGFHNSGFILSRPPGPYFDYQITFARPGTYRYFCLIHDGMKGTVRVT